MSKVQSLIALRNNNWCQMHFVARLSALALSCPLGRRRFFVLDVTHFKLVHVDVGFAKPVYRFIALDYSSTNLTIEALNGKEQPKWCYEHMKLQYLAFA